MVTKIHQSVHVISSQMLSSQMLSMRTYNVSWSETHGTTETFMARVSSDPTKRVVTTWVELHDYIDVH